MKFVEALNKKTLSPFVLIVFGLVSIVTMFYAISTDNQTIFDISSHGLFSLCLGLIFLINNLFRGD